MIRTQRWRTAPLVHDSERSVKRRLEEVGLQVVGFGEEENGDMDVDFVLPGSRKGRRACEP